jgi:radical SAM protein with 4Fe4S-binding SPASM domain
MLREVKIEITNLCYRNCKHCSSDATCDNNTHLFLSVNTIRNIIDQAHAMHVNSIVFTGGEATLHPSLLDIIKYAKQLGLHIKLYSMCYRTDDTLKLLQQLNENGLDEIIYSTAESLARGEELSTYSLEEFIASLIKNTNLSIGFHHVVTNQTIDCLNDLSKYIDASGDHINKLSFLRYVPHGRGNIDLIPSKDEMNIFKQSLLDLKDKYKDKIRIGSPFNVLNIDNTPCNAADETMIIGFDGHVYPCDAMKYFDYFGTGGNIYEQSLNDIYNSKYFTDIRNLKNNHNESCIKCKNYSICQSGCLGQKMVCATSLSGEKTLGWYELNAKRTMNNFATPELMRLNAKMGIAGETGEFIDCMKKLLTHDCNESQQEKIKRLMIDEMGDILWYLASSLSSYYHISFNEMGNFILNQNNQKIKLIDENMVKNCALKCDPDCPYNVINKGHAIAELDTFLSNDTNDVDLVKIWDKLDVVAFKLRRTDIKEEIISLSSDLIIILGKICHSSLHTTLEEVMTANVMRLQERYPMGFNSKIASDRIDVEEKYITDQLGNSMYLKKQS